MRTRSKSTLLTATAKSSKRVLYCKRINDCVVSRVFATSSVNKLTIELDVNTDIYPVEKDVYYKFVIASSVNADGSDTFDIIRFENEGSA